MEILKILVADNHDITRSGIVTLISDHFKNLVSIDDVGSREDFDLALASNKYNAIILETELLNLGIACEISDIRKRAKDASLLVITTDRTPEEILAIFDCGITNYILKSGSKNELIEAFNATISNRKYFSSEILDILLSYKSNLKHQVNENRKLTAAEIEIVKLIGKGLTTKEIAEQKCLSYHTIMTHRKNIFRKLSICNASELIIYAMKEGWIDTMEYYI